MNRAFWLDMRPHVSQFVRLIKTISIDERRIQIRFRIIVCEEDRLNRGQIEKEVKYRQLIVR